MPNKRRLWIQQNAQSEREKFGQKRVNVNRWRWHWYKCQNANTKTRSDPTKLWWKYFRSESRIYIVGRPEPCWRFFRLLFFYRFYYHSFARSLFAYFSSFRLFAIGLASIFPLSENSIHMMEFLTNNENNNSEFWIFNRKVVFTQHYHLHLMNILHSNCWWLILDIIDTRLMSNEKWVICINFLIKLMSLSLYN